jgi:hypothetical protein
MWDAAQAEEITLNALRDAVYEDAVAHGLWELPEERAKMSCDKMGHGAEGVWGENFLRSECASLVWDGAIELDRAYKSKDGFADELADVIIMSLSVAGKLGIDIDAAVKRKMEINKHRPWKHEGEKHEG